MVPVCATCSWSPAVFRWKSIAQSACSTPRDLPAKPVMLYPVQSCFGPVDMWNGRKWRAFHLLTHHVVLAPKYNSTILDLKRESDSNYTIVSSAFEACVGPHSYIIYTCFSLFLSMFWNHVASVDCGPFPFLTVLKREVQDASCSGRNPAGFWRYARQAFATSKWANYKWMQW